MGAVVGGVLAVGAVQQGRQARKEQRRARQIQQRSQRLQAGRSAIQAVREAQVQRASVIQAGENQGVGGSSAVLGGAGSIQSTTGSNIGFAQQIFGLQQQASRRLEQSAQFAGNADALGQFASMAVNTDLDIDFGFSGRK